ncbi:hypothetical protein [Marispirochaeta aestuarii]|uniref:hypothetical protein n=1 Tax=Marispirochaeta aestuarii TaxID=1963862 RepID=UPI0029C8F29F|nr:hypothetical protein [Marispirochaeta aestuarii]
MEADKEELRKYLRDLKEMKDLVARHEERPIVEYWDFVAWGVLLILGTLLHARFFPDTINTALLVIWLPVLIIGGFIETMAWVYLVKRLEMPLSSRRNQRFYLASVVILIAVIFILYYLIHLKGPIPGMLLLLLAVLFAFVAQMSYLGLFIETVLTLAAGIVLTVLDVRGSAASVGVGIFAGLGFIVMGIHTRFLEKRNG